MRATLFLLTASLLAAVPTGAAAQAKKLSDDEAKRVTALIRQLDSKKFQERDRAMKALGGFDERALPLLEKAAKSPVSLEVRRRLGAVIWKLRAPARAEEAKRVALLIRQLAADSFKERETAMRALQAVGRPALEQLFLTTLNPDVEITRRAEVIIGRILDKEQR